MKKIINFIMDIPENKGLANSPADLTIKIVNSTSRIAALIAMVWVVPMMLLITADVFARYVLNSPIVGVAELSSKMMIVIFLALAWCGVKDSHIVIDIVMNRFPKPVQRVVDIIDLFISIAVLGWLIWCTFMRADYAITNNSYASYSMPIPEAPFYIIVALSFVLLLLVVVALIIKRLREAKS
jgi:TRAP-type C4-dicarboxylate transport system permease small subunit